MLTRDENKTNALIRRLQDDFDRKHPQAQILVLGIDQGPPVDAPLEIVLYGPNTHTLRVLGEQFRQRLQELPDITPPNFPSAPQRQKWSSSLMMKTATTWLGTKPDSSLG